MFCTVNSVQNGATTEPFFDLAFVHLHNFVAVAIWVLWRRHESRLHWIFTALFFGATAAIALGAAAPLLARTGGRWLLDRGAGRDRPRWFRIRAI